MSIQDRVDNIYYDLLRTRNNFEYSEPVKSLSNNQYNIKKVLKRIVEANYDFLFTPAFDYFLISSSLCTTREENFRNMLYLRLLALTHIDTMLVLLSVYVDNWETYGLRHLKHAYAKDGHIIKYEDLFSDKEKELYDKYSFSKLRINCDKDLCESEYILLKRIFQIIGAYTLINDRIGDYDKLIDRYEHHHIEKIEELELHGICEYRYYKDYNEAKYNYIPEQLASYINNKIDNEDLILIR